MSMVEVLNELRKIRGKFLKEEGIYIFSKPEVYIALAEQQISVTPYYTDLIDFTIYSGPRLFFIYNREDVALNVDFLASPIPDLPDEDFINIKSVVVEANSSKIGLMKFDKYIYMKLKLYTFEPPSKGYTSIFIVRWGM